MTLTLRMDFGWRHNAVPRLDGKVLHSSSRSAWLPKMDAKKAACAKLLVAKAGALILKSMPERLSEEFLAEAFGIEVQELRYAFRHVCGVEIYKALRALRTDEVKRRLDANVNLSVEMAMQQCGFGSYAYFRKEFQKKFGVDPRNFRKTSGRMQEMPAGRLVLNRKGGGGRGAVQPPKSDLNFQR